MIWLVLIQWFHYLGHRMRLRVTSSAAKDLEILYLRQQLLILQRYQKRGPVIHPHQKRLLVLVGIALRRINGGVFDQSSFAFKPATIITWHRQLIKQKWRFGNQKKPGHPGVDESKRELVMRLTRENPGWGVKRIQGEVRKLGVGLSRTTIRNILREYFGPPKRSRYRSGPIWRQFITHYRQTIIACDFFTVDTIFLNTRYVLFFIDLSTRKVTLAGITANSTQIWVTQQARQFCWDNELNAKHFLIHDRDDKFPPSFDTVFVSEGVQVVKTPPQAPTANAYAERWVRTMREECPDQIVILNERHLRLVLKQYVDFYNRRRPHPSLQQQAPIPFEICIDGVVEKEEILGGIIHDYCRIA